jgi:hypothetical protein
MLTLLIKLKGNSGLGPPPPFQSSYLAQLDDVDGIPSSWLLEPGYLRCHFTHESATPLHTLDPETTGPLLFGFTVTYPNHLHS